MVARWCPSEGGGGACLFGEAFIGVRVYDLARVLKHFFYGPHLKEFFRNIKVAPPEVSSIPLFVFSPPENSGKEGG